jgi:hypothetical protein
MFTQGQYIQYNGNAYYMVDTDYTPNQPAGYVAPPVVSNLNSVAGTVAPTHVTYIPVWDTVAGAVPSGGVNGCLWMYAGTAAAATTLNAVATLAPLSAVDLVTRHYRG